MVETLILVGMVAAVAALVWVAVTRDKPKPVVTTTTEKPKVNVDEPVESVLDLDAPLGPQIYSEDSPYAYPDCPACAAAVEKLEAQKARRRELYAQKKAAEATEV